MTDDSEASAGKIASMIDDFPAMSVSQIGFNEYFVSNPSGDRLSGYIVDLGGPDCQCKDYQMRDDGEHICKHLAKAGEVAETTKTNDQWALRDIARRSRELHDAADDIRDVTKSWSSPDPPTDVSDDPDDTERNALDPDGHPVEAVEAWLEREGVPVDGMDVWEDDYYGSVQLETNGGLSDSEFQCLRELTSQDKVNYDRQNGRNYIRADDISAVIS